jgi:PPOX class probable FMN-dependent enzyme
MLNTDDALRSHYRDPSHGARNKVIDHLDRHCIDFLARSPMLILSTADAQGRCDGSPKGGEPGFAQALGPDRLAWADSSGNNRLDSFHNIVANPNVAALFLLPGLDETLRVNGTAELSTDADLCQRFSLGGRPAKVVVVLHVDEAYLHCAKAFRRARLWEPESWPTPDERPDPMCILKEHIDLDEDTEALRGRYQNDVEATLWAPGGEEPPADKTD